MNAGICLEKKAILTADSEVCALGFFSGQGKTHLMTDLMVLCFLFLMWKEKVLLRPESSLRKESGFGLYCSMGEASPVAWWAAEHLLHLFFLTLNLVKLPALVLRGRGNTAYTDQSCMCDRKCFKDTV